MHLARFIGFGFCTCSEVTGCDDDAVFMHLERAAQLAHHAGADIAFPALGLDSDVDLAQIFRVEHATHIDPAIASVDGYVYINKGDLR